MSMPGTNKRALWVVVCSIFIDGIGFGIMLPILPQLLTNPTSPHFLLSPGTSLSTGFVLMGVLSSVFPLMQFFATPVLGQLSDRYGRRPVLIASLFFTAVSYTVFSLAILNHNLPLLFLSRAIAGATSSSFVAAQAVIADTTPPKDRTKAFGLSTGMLGLGAFIFGPLLGGVLSSPSLVSWFTATTPFWFAAIASTVNAIGIMVFLTETNSNIRKGPLMFARSLKMLARAFVRPQLRPLFLTSFCLSAGASFLTSFYAVFLVHQFGFSETETGWFIGYTGIWMVVTQVFTTRFVAKRFREAAVLRFTLLAVAIAIAMYGLVNHSRWPLYLIAPFVSTFNNLAVTNLAGLISRSARPEEQGEVMGISASLRGLAMTFPPLTAGLIVAALSPVSAILCAAAVNLIAWAIFIQFYRPVEPT
jgi:MFS transporter, DHA1 family, tetracycline resistance protein